MFANRYSLLSAIVVASVGCKGSKTVPSVLVEIEATEPMSVQLADGVGKGIVHIPIRQVNSYGVGVPGGTAELAVRGGFASLLDYPGYVEFDAYGYAVAQVNAPDGAVFEVQVQSAQRTDDIGPAAVGYSIETEFETHGLAPSTSLPPALADAQRMTAGNEGVAVSYADEVWWFPAEAGALPHQVADLPYDIAGLWAAQIDGDGISDLVVWAESQLVLLRGRAGGGYGWGGAWSAQSRDISGVSPGDVNGDRLTDLTVASTDGDGTIVEVLLGDGQWGFEVLEPLGLSYPVESLTASDDERDGIPDVTVLSSATGKLRRYSLSEDGWVGGSPAEIQEFKAEPGSTMLPPVDMNDKGSSEIVIIGPQSGAQQMVFYVLGTPPVKFTLTFNQFEYSYTDVDGNGTDDILALEDNLLYAIGYNDNEDGFVSQSIPNVGNRGPIAAKDFDLDGYADVAILNDGIGFYRGGANPSGTWKVDTPNWTGYNESDVFGPFDMGDINGDGITDIASLSRDVPTTLDVFTFFYGPNAEGIEVLKSKRVESGLAFDQGSNSLDIALCGENLYALTGENGNQYLYRLTAVAETSDWGVDHAWDSPLIVSGPRLACSETPSGESRVAISSRSGDWTIYDQDKNVIESGSLSALDAIALADTNGDGVDEVVGCTSTGCSIDAGDLDGDGRDEVIRSSSSTSIEGWGGQTTIDAGGIVSIANIDGDDRDDVLIYDQLSSTLVVHRGLNGAIAPPAGLRTVRELRGPVMVGDVNGDGVSELLSIDMDGEIVHTSDSLELSEEDESEGDTGAAP